MQVFMQDLARGAFTYSPPTIGQLARVPAIVEVSDDLTSQSRHSLVLRGSPPAGKLLIPSAFAREKSSERRRDVAPKRPEPRRRTLERRDVRVVEGARLEGDFGDSYRATSTHFFAQSIQRLPAPECLSR